MEVQIVLYVLYCRSSFHSLLVLVQWKCVKICCIIKTTLRKCNFNKFNLLLNAKEVSFLTFLLSVLMFIPSIYIYLLRNYLAGLSG